MARAAGTKRKTASESALGPLLRQWRERRRMSQLTLAVEAEVSSRHLSFIETGRAKPSREMVLLLARVLEVPPRGRNELLLAAGYAPVYLERGLDSPEMSQVRRALDFMLRQQEPFPALVAQAGPRGLHRALPRRAAGPRRYPPDVLLDADEPGRPLRHHAARAAGGSLLPGRRGERGADASSRPRGGSVCEPSLGAGAVRANGDVLHDRARGGIRVHPEGVGQGAAHPARALDGVEDGHVVGIRDALEAIVLTA